jgi:hypothetical protein
MDLLSPQEVAETSDGIVRIFNQLGHGLVPHILLAKGLKSR